MEDGFFSGEVPGGGCGGYDISCELDGDPHPPKIHHQIEIMNIIKTKIRLYYLHIRCIIIITREYIVFICGGRSNLEHFSLLHGLDPHPQKGNREENLEGGDEAGEKH